MKTIRTVRSLVELDEELPVSPKYQVGDYLQIYNGRYEDHGFWVADVRFNHDHSAFEYLYETGLENVWISEARLVLLRRVS